MMGSQFSPEAMRERFWELTDQKEALNKELAPLRKKRDDMRDMLRPKLADFRAAGDAVKAIERPKMNEIDAEMAVISRALSNKVGVRPS